MKRDGIVSPTPYCHGLKSIWGKTAMPSIKRSPTFGVFDSNQGVAVSGTNSNKGFPEASIKVKVLPSFR